MIRLVLIFAFLLLAASGAAWLADHKGSVRIDFEGLQLTTSFAALALTGGLMVLATALTVWLVGWMRAEMPVVGSRRVIRRQAKGFAELNKALVALSSGDHKTAGRLVAQAEINLPPQPMVHLIAAEAATRSGNTKEAAKRYQALSESEDGRLIGLRGQLNAARKAGHANEALQLARAAANENTRSPWALKTRFSLEVAGGHWAEARDVLSAQIKAGFVSREDSAHMKAALLYAEGMEASLKSDQVEAKALLQKALKLRADFVPAIVALARSHHTGGKNPAAVKLIKSAWKDHPHPAVYNAFLDLDPAESKSDRVKRVRDLVGTNPDHKLSLSVLASALLDAGETEAAKGAIDRLFTIGAENLVKEDWALKARYLAETGENDPSIAVSIAAASEGPRWICSDCGAHTDHWAVLCDACGGFDTIHWQEGVQTTVHSGEEDMGQIVLLAQE